jgi:hypothetical protein
MSTSLHEVTVVRGMRCLALMTTLPTTLGSVYSPLTNFSESQSQKHTCTLTNQLYEVRITKNNVHPFIGTDDADYHHEPIGKRSVKNLSIIRMELVEPLSQASFHVITNSY